MLPWAPDSSLTFSVVFLLSRPCGRLTWMDKNNSSGLDSGIPCVRFATVILEQQYFLNPLWFESVVCGPWTEKRLQSGLISYSSGMSDHVLVISPTRCNGEHSSHKLFPCKASKITDLVKGGFVFGYARSIVLAKFDLCSNCSQKLDECSLARARKIFATARMLQFSLKCSRLIAELLNRWHLISGSHF